MSIQDLAFKYNLCTSAIYKYLKEEISYNIEEKKDNTDHNDNDNIFKVPFLACCIAKRNSGKSFLTKYLVKYFIDNGQIDEVMAFTQTNDMNNEYDYLKKKYVFDRYDDDKMDKIMELQKKQIKKYGKESKKVKNILIILDDIIGSLDAYSPVIRRLITQGRHYNISLILNIQISKRELSTDFRANADIFIVGYNNRNTFKSLYHYIFLLFLDLYFCLRLICL